MIRGAAGSPICTGVAVPVPGGGRHSSAFGGTVSRRVGATPIVDISGVGCALVDVLVEVGSEVPVPAAVSAVALAEPATG